MGRGSFEPALRGSAKPLRRSAVGLHLRHFFLLEPDSYLEVHHHDALPAEAGGFRAADHYKAIRGSPPLTYNSGLMSRFTFLAPSTSRADGLRVLETARRCHTLPGLFQLFSVTWRPVPDEPFLGRESAV